jgi:hypothetical protein
MGGMMMMTIFKVVAAGAAVVGLATFVFVGSYLAQIKEEEIHLLPEGFHGSVVIYFDMPNGQPPEHEGKARVYRIPSNGILYTKMKDLGERWIPDGHRRYYYVSKDSVRTQIQELYGARDPIERDRVSVFGSHNGSAEHNGETRTFESYVVGSRRDNVDSLLESSVNLQYKW